MIRRSIQKNAPAGSNRTGAIRKSLKQRLRLLTPAVLRTSGKSASTNLSTAEGGWFQTELPLEVKPSETVVFCGAMVRIRTLNSTSIVVACDLIRVSPNEWPDSDD
jgi:hypothetical protein